MSHEAQTSFYFLSLMCVKHARVRMCFVYFWTARTQVLSASFGVIFWGTHFTLIKGLFPKRLTILHWNLALETYIFSTYNFIRVPRSKNLFCNILARSGFRDFALFLVFLKMFLVFWGLFQVFWGCSGFSGGVPGFLGVFRVFGCSRMFRCSWKYYIPFPAAIRSYMLQIPNSAKGNCLKEKENHILRLKSDIKINKFANYQNIIVRNSPAFDCHVWSRIFEVMRMISTQTRWQDPCWSLCKL